MLASLKIDGDQRGGNMRRYGCSGGALARQAALAFVAAAFPLVAALSAEQSIVITPGILLSGTVVTMDARGRVLKNGNVLVRNGTIVGVWNGPNPPAGLVLDNVAKPALGPGAMIFPGLIDLHDHPGYDVLHTWPAPSSHVQADLGRPIGTEPYAYRYQWNPMFQNDPPEQKRLVEFPNTVLTQLLNLDSQVGKYAEVKAILGGETTFEGAESLGAAGLLVRNVEQDNFGESKRVRGKVAPIVSLDPSSIVPDIQDGLVDAFLVHLGEGVRDGERRPGDFFSSRREFLELKGKGLLTDVTVVVHGTALEPEDFVEMRAAPSIRLDASGDGLGAKLVWSPLSNLLLYGHTALVYHALQAGVLVSLGTDWSPSGSRTLLDELKIADIALRDERLLGKYRDVVASLSLSGKSDDDRKAAEALLDLRLVQMVTTNPARTLRWFDKVGSIEVGKTADLLVITKPAHPSAEELPDTPYRNLIDATEKEVRLVLVDGEPLAGDVSIMATLKPGDYEVVHSTAGCFDKAVDVTNPGVRGGAETLDHIQSVLTTVLTSLAGDNPPPGGGPADLSNTYHLLKQLLGMDELSDADFEALLIQYAGLTSDGRLNLEAVALSPLFVHDDDFYFHLMGAETFADGLIADSTPPFGLYLANFNHFPKPGRGNPFSAPSYRNRYYTFCSP
jgi:cytosine/adenosine deaminase-related metal-dependent hydrolase